MTALGDAERQSDAAEQATLGAMLLSPAVAGEIASIVCNEAAFARPAHRTIYRTITQMQAAGEPVDPVTLAGRLAERGELAKVGGGNYLHDLTAAVPTAANGSHYAGAVVELADRRRTAELGTRLIAAAAIADPEQRSAHVDIVLTALADCGPSPGRQAAPRAAPLDWSAFLAREQGPVDFLSGRLMVRGQQIALVGAGKAGKSLFSVEWAWRISAGLPFLGDHARPPLRVMYIDQENPDDDIQERLLSLGATAETLSNLTYLSFPAFRPLNTEAGAADLLAAVDEYQPAVLFLDTISRMVKGKENEADPWLDLYRLALMPLKARRVSSIRLDHFGKDVTRGGRGNSAKTQDVDAVWELVPVDDDPTLLQLNRTHTRNGKGHDELLLRRRGEQIGDRWKVGGTWHSVADASERPDTKPNRDEQFPPAARRVLGVIGTSMRPMTVREIGDELAAQTAGSVTKRTIQLALNTLADAGLAEELEKGERGKGSIWIGSVQ